MSERIKKRDAWMAGFACACAILAKLDGLAVVVT